MLLLSFSSFVLRPSSQVKGYIGRYITYTGPDFKEGLSLSIHDEISRMRKYAFGCSELVFNPLSQWFCR